MRKLLLALTLILLSIPALSADKPNVVFIVSDDHDYEHLGFAGSKKAKTPAIDQLAKEGSVFNISHLPMSRCRPTLASFLSGKWPHQSGIYFNYGKGKLNPANTIGNLMKKAGYECYAEGKFWEGDIKNFGFDYGAGKNTKQFVRKDQNNLDAFIEKFAGKKPMFIWWAPLLPHTPHNPPERMKKLFNGNVKVSPYYKGDKSKYQKKEKTLLAMTSWLDEGVAQMVKKLKDKKQYENTLFVFLIDNGWCNGLPSKGSPFEKGVRTPIIFTYPKKIKGGQTFNTLTSTLDSFPTILEYCGIKVPNGAAGQSLKPIIDGKKKVNREKLFGAIYPAFAKGGSIEKDVYALYVRTEKWKFIYYVQDVDKKGNGKKWRIQHILCDYPNRKKGHIDLFEINKDPYEQKNVAPQHKKLTEEFKKEVLDWWKKTGGKSLKL